MRYLAILISVLMLSACGGQKIKRAMHADCRLQGYEQGTSEFNDCVTVATHNFKMQYYLGQQVRTGQAMQSIGQKMMKVQPGPVAIPQPVQPKTKFCYPGQGYVYCQ